MEKYLTPKQSHKKYKTEHSVDASAPLCCEKIETDIIVANDKKERVIDDEYLNKRYAIEQLMDSSDYDEFESVMSTCRDDLKEIQKTMKKAIDGTICYAKKDVKFKQCTDKYNVVESLQSAAEHVDVAVGLARNAAGGAQNVWNDIIHDAMDLQDSMSNKNDPEEALYDVL